MATRALELSELRRKVEEARERSIRASAGLEATLKTLLEDYGCKTLDQAEAKLKELQASLAKARARYERELKAFVAKYQDMLELEG